MSGSIQNDSQNLMPGIDHEKGEGWYVFKSGQEYGPFAFDHMIKLLQEKI